MYELRDSVVLGVGVGETTVQRTPTTNSLLTLPQATQKESRS